MGAKAGVTVKIMPDGTEVNLDDLKSKVEEFVKEIYGEVGEIRSEEEPIAFGLKALKMTFIIDEDKGTEVIEEKIRDLEEVASVQTVEFMRLT